MKRRDDPIAPVATGVLAARPLLGRAVACVEGAFSRVEANNAEALRLLTKAQARLAEARAILEAAEHEAQNAS